jgi:hypothetical protein
MANDRRKLKCVTFKAAKDDVRYCKVSDGTRVVA